jgi:hypothetical protein
MRIRDFIIIHFSGVKTQDMQKGGLPGSGNKLHHEPLLANFILCINF